MNRTLRFMNATGNLTAGAMVCVDRNNCLDQNDPMAGTFLTWNDCPPNSTTPATQSSGQTWAFTLIELLVVISIIALLIAILSPSLARARASAKAVQCQSNMRQLGVATLAYTGDYDGYHPQPAHDDDIPGPDPVEANRNQAKAVWFNALDYYLGQSKKDYRDGDADARHYKTFKQDPIWLDLDETSNEARNTRTIKMNQFFGDIDDAFPNNDSDWKFFKDGEIDRPSKTVLYLDGRARDTPSVTTGNIDVGGAGLFGATEIFAGLRHEDGANVTFADGHGRHHRDAVRESGSGYRGWFNGDNGPHELFWRIGR